jgi:hypothetical protein
MATIQKSVVSTDKLIVSDDQLKQLTKEILKGVIEKINNEIKDNP